MQASSTTSEAIVGAVAAEASGPCREGDLRECGVALLCALAIAAPVLGLGGRVVFSAWREREEAKAAAVEASFAHERLVAAAPLATLPVNEAARGRDLFLSACVACHGQAGTGVDGLGKNLVESDFVAGQTDEGLAQFLVVGRPFAKPAPMPPKAGRDDLSAEDLRQIVVYVRGLQDPRRLPELPAPKVLVGATTEAEKATALAAAGGDAELAGYIASGTKLFNSTCIACHGAGGAGIKGNGKTLAKNDFIRSLDDDALLAFIKRGRDPSDPKNTTGVGMPPKGGNPALSEDDLLDIIAYLRTLQPAAAGVGK
jgi:disulfide bond formation protein DsbB